METAVNEQKATFAEGGSKFQNVPTFQVVNDVGSSVRWISGQMITLEFGEHSSQIAKIGDWTDRMAQSIDFQQRFDALNDDLSLAVALDKDLERFKDGFLSPLLARLSPVETAEAV